MYYRLGKYPEAVQQLEKTVSLKSDWANAYYNLANAYRMNKQLQQSYDAYQNTLVLLPAGAASTGTDGAVGATGDFSKVKSEQDEVKKALDELQAQQNSAQQQAAQPTPTPKPTPKPKASPVVSPSPAAGPAVQGATTTNEGGVPMSPTVATSPQPSPTEEANPSVQPTP